MATTINSSTSITFLGKVTDVNDRSLANLKVSILRLGSGLHEVKLRIEIVLINKNKSINITKHIMKANNKKWAYAIEKIRKLISEMNKVITK